MPNKELLEAITSSDFLNGCSFDSSSVIRKAYSAGAYLSDNNNGKGFIGLIASGILDIYSVALDGRDTMLNSLHKGNCFGICNLFDCTQMETVIRSRTNAVVYFIPEKYHCNRYGTECFPGNEICFGLQQKNTILN